MFFSVIVPIYKVEKYLTRCIESVLSQSFADFELILVDDGSPDGCPAICDEYAAREKRIRVVHKENGGLVSARQAGIRVASGDYVFNLDGDDALESGVLEAAAGIIRRTDADIVSFSYRECRGGVPGEIVSDLAEEGLYRKPEMAEHLYPKLLVDDTMRHLFYFVWGKAIRRTLLTPHQLGVSTKISLGEDLSCIVPCYLEAQTVYMSRQSGYLYTIRDDSISTSFQTGQLTQIADVIAYLQQLTVRKPADFEAQLARYSCYMCFAILAAAAEGKHASCMGELKALIDGSVHRELIAKAEFSTMTKKSRVGIFFMKKNKLGLAFWFLYLCKLMKQILRKG